jgi:ABC-type molybdate transport system substrate-binding protein
VTLVGQLPGDLNNKTVFAAGLIDKTPSPEAAQAFLRALVDPAARAKFAMAGFEPLSRP